MVDTDLELISQDFTLNPLTVQFWFDWWECTWPLEVKPQEGFCQLLKSKLSQRSLLYFWKQYACSAWTMVNQYSSGTVASCHLQYCQSSFHCIVLVQVKCKVPSLVMCAAFHDLNNAVSAVYTHREIFVINYTMLSILMGKFLLSTLSISILLSLIEHSFFNCFSWAKFEQPVWNWSKTHMFA